MKEVYGYIYLTYDQKTKKVYIGHSTKLNRYNIENYYGSGVMIKRIIKKRGTYFLKKTILGYCYSKEELIKCETECKYFFNTFDRLYGYNIAIEDHSGNYWVNHPNKKLWCKKISKSKKGHWEGNKNPMYGISNLKKWEEKYGKEDAKKKWDKKCKEHSEKMKGKMKGKDNPMYGSTINPKIREGWKKWYEEGNHVLSGETKKKISNTKKGVKSSEETKKKLSEAQRKRYKNGAKGSNFGKKASKETREKMSKARKGKRKGKDNPMYGKSVFDVWIEKYGYEEALKRKEERTRKCLETKKKKQIKEGKKCL